MKPNRRSWLKQMLLGLAGVGLGQFKVLGSSKNADRNGIPNALVKPSFKNQTNMKLGAFSVSLNVKDLIASKQFYEDLGFTVFAGSLKVNYLIMKNENALIGLFQGMFKHTILTFNPGWDEDAKKLETFEDVRKIQQQLKEKGIKLATEADEKTSGPAGFFLTDPDGNSILIDQHV